MATTQNEHNGDGSNRRFPFTFPYIKEDDVKVSLRTSTADVTDIASTTYTFPSATEIQFSAVTATTFQTSTGAPKTGVTVRIFRDTDLETQRVTFFPGSSIRAQDLNDNTLQNLYASQERQSRAVDSTGGALTGNLELNNADIVFEGATADDFETTLTVVNPTADRTITLPNVTGTVVTTGDTGTVNSTMLGGSAVTSAKIAGDAVDGSKIADDSINSEHYAAGSIDLEHMSANSVDSDQYVNGSIDLIHMSANSVDSDQYVDGSIDRVHLAADIVDGTKIADNAIDSEHYVDGSIDTVHLASLIGTGLPSTNTRTPVVSVNNKGQVTSIISSDIVAADIADGEISTAKIADDAVTAAKIAANAITSDDGQLANNSVVTAKIKDLNVTTGKLAADAVTGAKIADNAVNSEHYTDGSIDRVHLAADIVDGTKIADNSIDSEHYVDGSIDAIHLATSAVTTGKINADAITNAKIANDAVQKENINGLTAEIADLNQIDGKTLVTSATWSSNTQFPSAANIDARITARIDPIDGFVAIADEDSFPATTPPEGTAVSISNAGGMVIGASASTTDASRAGGSDTVTIQNIPTNMQSQTVQDGIGMVVIATSTAHTYDFHRVIATNADVITLSGDINDFNNRYRVGSSNPTTDNDAGDLFFNTGSNKMLVRNSGNSAWEEVQSVGNFFIVPSTDFPTWNGSLNDISLSANAPANAEQIILSLNGVVQQPVDGTARPSSGFSLNGSTIQLSAAPAAGTAAFAVILGSTVNIGTPSNDTITNAMVTSSAAIAGTKISPDFGSQNIVTTGKVGIGTTSPGEDLHVFSSAGAIKIDSGGDSALRFAVSGTNKFSIFQSNDTLRFFDNTNNSERMRIDSAGNVGINQTSINASRKVEITQPSSYTSALRVNSAGSSGNPALIEFFVGSSNYKIGGHHSTDQLKFMRNTAELMIIDSAGNVSIGSSTFNLPSGKGLQVYDSSTPRFKLANSTTGTGSGDGSLLYVSGNDFLIENKESANMRFYTSATERMRIDSAGRVGIGSGSQDLSAFNANGSQDLVVYSRGTSGLGAHAGITLFGQSETASQCSLTFADGAGGAQRYAGSIDYLHSNDSLSFRVNTSNAMRIDSAHRAMLGVTSSVHTYRKLQIVGKYTDGQRQGALLRYGEASSNGPVLTFEKNRSNSGGTSSTAADDNLGEIHFQGTDQGGSYRLSSMIKGVCDATPANNTTPGRLQFYTAPVGTSQSPQVRMTIDSSGRLLVGTSTAFGSTSSELLQIANANGGKIGLLRDDASIGTGNEVGVITWYSADGNTQPTASIACQADADHAANDKPGRLVFSTTQDNASSVTERMKLDREGVLSHNSSSHGVQTCLTASAGTSKFAYRGLFNTSAGLYAGTVSYIVWSNGNVENTNNSYGSISDVKLKENIVDANSQWNDIKQLQVRNYNFKENTGLETHKQLGLIAQEAETVSPGLVYETADVGDDGEELGTVTKKLNYSVLYMKAVKALQEAIARIETLETKIATLEAK